MVTPAASRTVRAGLIAAAALVALASGCPRRGEFGVQVLLYEPPLDTEVVGATVYVLSRCDNIIGAGEEPPPDAGVLIAGRTIFRDAFDAAGPSLGRVTLAPGAPVGLYVRGWNARCEVIGRGCQEEDLAAHREPTIALAMRLTPPQYRVCDGGARCAAMRCELHASAPDAGVLDGGLDGGDASAPDGASADAPPADAPPVTPPPDAPAVTPTCAAGTALCGTGCAPIGSTTNCEGGPNHQCCASGCVDTRTSDNYCGRCGRSCGPRERCRDGNCVQR